MSSRKYINLVLITLEDQLYTSLILILVQLHTDDRDANINSSKYTTKLVQEQDRK